MTKVIVNSGSCGFTTTVEVTSIDKRKVSIKIHSACEQIMKLAEDLSELEIWDIYRTREESKMYSETVKHNLHPACPVPIGILKAVEVEVKLALPRDATIHFVTREDVEPING